MNGGDLKSHEIGACTYINKEGREKIFRISSCEDSIEGGRRT